MSAKPDGGPAFTVLDRPNYAHTGMSLRAYIATKALSGLLSCEIARVTEASFLVKEAVEYADALISELSKEAK